MTLADEEPGVVWINTIPDPVTGVYHPVVSFDADNVFPLDEQTAIAYAMYLLRACATASHDAAVVAQLTHITNGDVQAAVQIREDLRQERPEAEPVSQMAFSPHVSARTGEPFLLLRLKGETVGQWTVPDAREHAVHVLEAVYAGELDSAYLRTLRSMGLDDNRGRAAVADLAHWRRDGNG